MASAVFICDFGFEDKLLGIIVQSLSCVFEFNVVKPLAINEFSDFCDELAGPFESCSFASYMCEMHLLCKCEGYRNKI